MSEPINWTPEEADAINRALGRTDIIPYACRSCRSALYARASGLTCMIPSCPDYHAAQQHVATEQEIQTLILVGRGTRDDGTATFSARRAIAKATGDEPATDDGRDLATLGRSAATSLYALWEALREANLDHLATDVEEWHAGVREIMDETEHVRGPDDLIHFPTFPDLYLAIQNALGAAEADTAETGETHALFVGGPENGTHHRVRGVAWKRPYLGKGYACYYPSRDALHTTRGDGSEVFVHVWTFGGYAESASAEPEDRATIDALLRGDRLFVETD